MSRQSFTLADHHDAVGHGVNMRAPLPLGYHTAIRLAVTLRLEDPKVWTYPTIAALMTRYHGFRRSVGWWHVHCRAAGAPQVRDDDTILNLVSHRVPA